MDDYIQLTLKNKSKITYKKFYWSGENKSDSISYHLSSNKKYYIKRYIEISKKIEQNISKSNIKFKEYNLVKYSYISEHCIYTTPHIIDILKTLVFLDLIKNYKNKITQIKTNLQNKQVNSFLKKNIKYIDYKIILRRENRYFKLSSFIPEIIKGNILFLKILILYFKFTTINKNKEFKDKYYFISYLSNKKIDAKSNFKIFFGELFKLLSKLKIKHSLIFHALQDNLPNIEQIEKYKKQNAHFFRSELKLNDYLNAYWQYFKLFFKVINLNKKEIFYNNKFRINFYHLFENQYKKSFYGVKYPETILNIISSKKIINKIPSDSKLFYIAENQSWEKFIIKEAAKKNIKTFGCIHSLVNKWDLRFSNIYTKGYFGPTKLLINGRYNKHIINNNTFKKNYPYEYVEALRYNRLKKIKKLNTKNILVCGSIEILPTIKMLNELSKSKKLISNYSLFFKPHPANKLDLTKYNFLRPFTNNTEYFLTIGPDPTSIIIDFYLKEIPYITYLSDEYVNSNFFKILKTNLYFSNFLKLEKIIFSKKIKLKKTKSDGIFFLNNKLTLWKNFLNKKK